MAARSPEQHAPGWRGYALAVSVVILATAVSWAGRGVLATADLAALYMLGIMVLAGRFGQGPTAFAAALSTLAYNFFFVPPAFSFVVDDARHLLTFAMMFGVGISTSALTSRIRGQEREARAREERTAALYALSRALGAAANEGEGADLVAHHVSDVLGSGVAVLRLDETGTLVVVARAGQITIDAEEQRIAEAACASSSPLAQRMSEPRSRAAASFSTFVLRVGSKAQGVLCVATPAGRVLSANDAALVEAFAQQAAQTLARLRSVEDARLAALRARTEEMRSSLLSAVSHDLRTPLAVIAGSATTLRDEPWSVSVEQRADLVVTICEEAERLERLVDNLLDMTRVESGTLVVKRTWTSLDELLAAVLERMEPRLEGRAVSVELPEQTFLVFLDPLLFGQVFFNLLDNAAKYTPLGTPVEIRACVADDLLEIEVADRGGGLAPEMIERVFEKFVRGSHAAMPGAGLGLAICRGIVEAHGGSLRAALREAGGTTFRISLPTATNAPPIAYAPNAFEGMT